LFQKSNSFFQHCLLHLLGEGGGDYLITKTKLLTAVLCTFCLTAALFSTMPVESAGTYDPWIDTNHDGRINVLDLIKVAGGIGTFGNPGLNVTVTNPALNVVVLNATDTNIAWPNSTDQHVWWNTLVDNTSIISEFYSAKGFSHLHVLAGGVPSGDTISIKVYGLLYNSAHTNFLGALAYNVTLTFSQQNIAFSIPVPGQSFYFLATGSSATKRSVYLTYYLTWA
jgi:hypothetical protein